MGLGETVTGEELTLGGEKRDSRSLCAGTTGSPYTVDIVLRVIWIVIIQNMSDVTDVFIEHVSKDLMANESANNSHVAIA